jgi:SAM-dependent methyltransferase
VTTPLSKIALTPGLKPLIWTEEWLRGVIRDPKQFVQKRTQRRCSCCGYHGYFVSMGWHGPPEYRCPNCSSRPRDRQIALILATMGLDIGRLLQMRLLHIAPEWWIFRQLRGSTEYVGGDIIKRRNGNAIVDITNIEFPDDHFELLICNHVLEHVPDDRRGMSELFRILKPDGLGIVTVPIKIDSYETWEPPVGMPTEEIDRICGRDHKRNYGLDFADRLASVGFEVFQVWFDEAVRQEFSLLNEPVYLVSKDRALHASRAAALSKDLAMSQPERVA